jgi:acid stress chaperone HdeB
MRAGLLLIGLTLLALAPAHAQVTVDITKITCRQFLVGKAVSTNAMALWFSGYYSGKKNVTLVDMGTLRSNAEKVKDFCRLHQEETVMKAVASALSSTPSL